MSNKTEEVAKYYLNKGFFSFQDVKRVFGLDNRRAHGVIQNIRSSQKYTTQSTGEGKALEIQVTEIRRKADQSSETTVMHGEKYRGDLWRKAIFGQVA